MQECPCCKKTFSDGVASCPKCFIPLMPKQETWPCPECGEPIPASATRCFHCGGGLEYGPEEDLTPDDGGSVDWQAVEPDAEPRARPVPRVSREKAKGKPGVVGCVWLILIVIYAVLRLKDSFGLS